MPKDFDNTHVLELEGDPIHDGSDAGFSIRGSAKITPIASQTPSKKKKIGPTSNLTPRNTMNGRESTTPSATSTTTSTTKKRRPDQPHFVPPAKRRVPQPMEKIATASTSLQQTSETRGKPSKSLLDESEVKPHFSKKVTSLDDFVDSLPVDKPKEPPTPRAPARKAQDMAIATAKRSQPSIIRRPGATTVPRTLAPIRHPGTTIQRPGVAKSAGRNARGLISQKKKKPITIPLKVFYRGVRMAEGEDCHLKWEMVGGETNFTPWTGSVKHWDLTFQESSIGTLYQVDEQAMLVNIKLKSSYATPINGQFIVFTAADEESFNHFLEIVRNPNGREAQPQDNPHIMEQFFDFNFTKYLRDHKMGFIREPPVPPEVQLQIERDAQLAKRVQAQPQRVRETRSAAMKAPAKEDRTVITLQADEVEMSAEPLGKRPKRQSTRLAVAEKIIEKKVPQLSYPEVPWKSALLYPFEGAKRANVDYGDLKRLEDEEFLNDNIINFYMRYIEDELQKLHPELHKQTHFFNTFFYERLSAKGEGAEKRLDAVLKWTNRIDLFSKNYIVVPINENSHWYLALICNLQNLPRKLNGEQLDLTEDPAADSDATIADVKSEPAAASEETPGDPMDIDTPDGTTAVKDTQEKMSNMALGERAESEWPDQGENPPLDPELKEKNKLYSPDKKKKKPVTYPSDSPCIIVLDSMSTGVGHSQTFKNIKGWLVKEALVKRSLNVKSTDIISVNAKAPSQNNWYDCGLFVLHYAEKFFQKPTTFVKAFLSPGRGEGSDLEWDEEVIHKRRVGLFNLMLKLHDDYEAHEKNKKEAAKLSAEVKAVPSTPSKPPSTSSPPAAPPALTAAASLADKAPDVAPVEAPPAPPAPEPPKKSPSPVPESEKDEVRIKETPQPQPKITDEIPESPQAPKTPPPSGSLPETPVNLTESDQDEKMQDAEEAEEEEEPDRSKPNSVTMMGSIRNLMSGKTVSTGFSNGISFLTGRKPPASKANSTAPSSPTPTANSARSTESKATPSKSAQEVKSPPRKLSEPEGSEAVSLANTWGTTVDDTKAVPNAPALSISVPTPANSTPLPSALGSPVDFAQETPTQRRRSPRNAANAKSATNNTTAPTTSPSRASTRSSSANNVAATAGTGTPPNPTGGGRKLKRRRPKQESPPVENESASKKPKPVIVDLSDDTPEKEKPGSQEL